ncbi:hypothetical protein HYFRA_00002048 [Hymenoscyphus fraxineus]|uniref:Ubiquitin-like domain-containing protein n=1 Tax=Hymenoscyphus fraxineus TaxID=746836 RepID=A0A9N9PJQ7_9HELO|nr:hypothetical protein HYFRA_00002048 [Hymenoscyphus fraxineus]
MPTKRKRSNSDIASTPTLDHIPEVEDHGGIHASFRDLMPNSPQTIAFLHGPRFSDAMNEAATAINTTGTMNVTPAQAVEELRRFLALKVFIHDDKAEKLSPTPIMTFMWQAAILNTQFHLDLQASLPFLIHYRPSEFSAAEAEARRVRLITMESLYHRFFGTNPLGSNEQPRENALQVAVPNVEGNGNAVNLEAPDEDAKNDEDAVILDDSDDDLEKNDNSDDDSEIESVKISSELSGEASEDERESTPDVIKVHVSFFWSQRDSDVEIGYYSTFSELFKVIAQRYSLSHDQFGLFFNGFFLKPLDTPDGVNMGDGDTVEVHNY